MFSTKFKEVLNESLITGRVIGTIMQKSNPIADQIKARKDVKIFTVTFSNRGKIPHDIISYLEI